MEKVWNFLFWSDSKALERKVNFGKKYIKKISRKDFTIHHKKEFYDTIYDSSIITSLIFAAVNSRNQNESTF